MGSSKEAVEWADVPEQVNHLSKTLPGVVICNLRPDQRASLETSPKREHMANYGDGTMISDEFEFFLNHLKSPIMAVLLYQLYGTEICTVIVRLEPVTYWATDGLPRLEFEQPENWNHCSSMWGGFVLAVAQVQNIGPTQVVEDQDASYFLWVAKNKGIPTAKLK